jgi:hypothetical protein
MWYKNTITQFQIISNHIISDIGSHNFKKFVRLALVYMLRIGLGLKVRVKD